MKKILISLLCLSSLLYSGLFSEDVSFKEANQNITRKFPSSEKYILSYSNVLKNIRTSVVNIYTKQRIKTGTFASPFFGDPFFDYFFKGFGERGFNVPRERIQQSLGSGVIITENGYIVTNNHVVEDADEIRVSLPGDKNEYEAELIGTDDKSDLAVIKIDKENLNAITFYDSDNVAIGDIVFAMGNPFGVGETITQGIISATGRSSVGIVEDENFIQTDAPINPGNSGGALVNSAGYLIGINSAIISKGGGNVGIGFAIPSNMVKSITKALIEDGKFTRAYLGVTISDMNSELSDFYGKKFGALVTSVEDDTPAKKAGIQRGDLIVSVDGKEVKSSAMLKNIISTKQPNTVVKIKFLRDSTLMEKNIKLTHQKNQTEQSNDGYDYQGITVKQISNERKAENHVVVIKVDTDSSAYKSGLREGDIVIQIENLEIKTLDDFKSAIKKFGKKRVYVNRNNYILAFIL